MKRLFIDSSVLFSAAYSARGHACDLVVMAAREEVILGVISLGQHPPHLDEAVASRRRQQPPI